LHANDAIGAVARLDDWESTISKIGGALLAQSRSGYYGRICPECKEAIRTERTLLKTLCKDRKRRPMPFTTAVGLQKCLGTGYSVGFDLRDYGRHPGARGRNRKTACHTQSCGKLLWLMAWWNWPQPVWSRCWPVARRWKKCFTSFRVSDAFRFGK